MSYFSLTSTKSRQTELSPTAGTTDVAVAVAPDLVVCHDYDLSQLNTMGLSSFASNLVVLQSETQLPALAKWLATQLAYLVLGGGSNVVLASHVHTSVILNQLKGIALIGQTPDHFLVRAGAGEVWHDFVTYCLNQGWYGLENLALIPGTVGAAPVQNIGAYGIELKDFCESVRAYDPQEKKFLELTHLQCQFSYRDSYFKHKGKNLIICSVTFKLPKQWSPRLDYPDLKNHPKLQVSASAVTTDNARVTAEDTLDGASIVVSSNTLKDTSKSILKNIATDISKDISEDLTKDISKDVSKDIYQDTTRRVAQRAPNSGRPLAEDSAMPGISKTVCRESRPGELLPTSQQVFDAVCEIRRQKLPDPTKLGNVGSFFKNPVVSAKVYAGLKRDFPDLSAYAQTDGNYKLAAAWLIDRCGWKGRSLGKAGVHQRQALVLVNLGQAESQDIKALAAAIQQDVLRKFNISLEPEPIYVD